MLRAIRRILVAVLALIGLVAVFGAIVLLRDGIGSRAEPDRLELAVARRVRSLAIPREARYVRNPVPQSAQATESGLEHFADHCAICHGNDGSGDTTIGGGLYPKPPDMRLPATQDLSDGELFYIIENGVKLTGMPAWSTGTSEGELESWRLVHFIRRLPQLTPAELARMRALNPRGRHTHE